MVNAWGDVELHGCVLPSNSAVRRAVPFVPSHSDMWSLVSR